MTEEWYREQAYNLFHRDGEIEVDHETPEQCKVSMGGDGGAYVQAWIWISDPDKDEES